MLMPNWPGEASYHGKLLLTGEYFVLDGVPALAVPTKLGQKFMFGISTHASLIWRSYDVDGSCWFEHLFPRSKTVDFYLEQERLRRNDDPAANRIWQLLRAVVDLSGQTLESLTTSRVIESHLEFDRNWGLGSSSTLVAALAEKFEVNPYELLEKTFGGSGYDLACATADGPLIYKRNGTNPTVTPLDWSPDWLNQTYFIYRNQKQNSREGIKAYRSATIAEADRRRIGELTTALATESLHPRAVAQLLREHEAIVGRTLNMTPVQQEIFPDFPGQIKSLGAWGGDFIWVLSERDPADVRAYFNERGYETVIPYHEMIL